MDGDVDVVNSALVLIGSESIMSMDETSKEARTSKLVFKSCRQFVLRAHPWNFAVDRVSLSPLSTAPAFGFAARFQIPPDGIRILSVNDGDVDYRIEGRTILTDEETIELRYVKDEVDITKWDSMACEGLAAYLAWKIAYKITGSDSLKDELWKNFNMVLKKARNVDAQEEPASELQAEDNLQSRQGFNQGFVRDPQT